MTADGHPPPGVAPAAVTGPPAPAGGSGGGGGGDRGDGDGGDEDGGSDDAGSNSGQFSGAGTGGGGEAGDTRGGYFSKLNRPVMPVEGRSSQEGRLGGLLGETSISPDGLRGGGQKVPRMRGYSCKPDSPLSRRLACRLGRGRP